MTDPVAEAARAAAATLAPELGAQLPAQVEAALAARDQGWLPGQVETALAARDHGERRPGQYDPLAVAGLAVAAASLIVTIAQLAWSVYTDQRRHAPEPSPEAIARQIHITLRQQDTPLPDSTDHITEVIITEIIRKTRPPQ